MLAASVLLAIAPLSAQGAAIDWVHLNGSMASNGSVTVKSLSGGSYTATQNPSGAVAKANQNAATQPPTVVIQATASGLPFNYKDDCFVFNGVGIAAAASYSPSGWRIGTGKLDASNNFTGVAAYVNTRAASVIFSGLTGATIQSTSGFNEYGTNFQWAGNSASLFWNATDPVSGSVASYTIVGATALPVVNASKCYP